jgi:hypothetical protein
VTANNDVRSYADAIMAMIKEDQDSGQVPGDVLSWDELDDSVDTDDYYRQARLPSGTSAAASLRSAVTDEVNRRLASSQGGPWGVTWTRPDGQVHDIGRTAGYPTRTEAEGVGERYLSEHGGGYTVHRG